MAPKKKSTKLERGMWDEVNMCSAVRQVLQEGVSQASAAKSCGVPRETLRRHLEIVKSGGIVKKKLGRKTVLTREQETELKNLILEMEKRMFGITITNLRSYVFQFCEENKIHHPFNKNKKTAGRDWTDGFLQRNPELSLRKPEATSMQRAIGFNKPKVDLFFKNLQSVLFDDKGKRLIPPENIYNADESGYTCVHKPGKILAQKGKRCVGAITSGEKGKTVTVLACVSAVGHYVPPMIIFPRVRLRQEFLDKAPPGSIGAATPSGWINENKFEDWFDHFLNIVQPKSRLSPTLLIVDGHASHTKNLSVILKARKNNVILLCLPSHCTHKLQPLDVAVFKSVNTFYDQEISHWLLQHPGRVVGERDIPELFSTAYSKGATLQNAISGFRKTGINPFNPHTFTEEDFIASELTDHPISEQLNELQDSGEVPCASQVSLVLPEIPAPALPSTSRHFESTKSVEANSSPPTFRDIIKIPKGGQRKTTNRKVSHSTILTDSPHKNQLQSKKETPVTTKTQQKRLTLKKKSVKVLSFDETQDNKQMEDANCIYCNELYSESDGEDWICCQKCDKWSHVLCAGVSKHQMKFICGVCT